MEAKGKDLIFIKQIAGDGSELTIPVKTSLIFEQDTTFRLRHLSITNGTFIASAMNTYIVKLKDIPKKAIQQKLEVIITNHTTIFGELDEKSVINDFIKQHKQDVLNAYCKAAKLMDDTLSSVEADLMANEYYTNNFE